jgi:hypothetical protein
MAKGDERRSGGGKARWPTGSREASSVSSYMDGDPRLLLRGRQALGMRYVARGEPVDSVARACGVAPSRVKRWLKTPRFRRAVFAERVHPTDRDFAREIAARGVVEANEAQRALGPRRTEGGRR